MREENRKSGSRRNQSPKLTESDIIEKSSIVFSTFGSLQRSEFTGSSAPLDLMIIEEAGKLHDGDLMAKLALATGMKNTPSIASPFLIVMVGDENQLEPHSRLDPNLKVSRLCPSSFFTRYVTKCESLPESMDLNYPVTLLSQHRAHKAIADVHSHFAYKGIIETGDRESLEKWNDDEMDQKIKESCFKLRTVSIFSFKGSVHGDVRGPPSTSGNTNALVAALVIKICEDWFYRSQKFSGRVTVLSPYRVQVDKIEDMLRFRSENQAYRGLSTVTCHTVHSCQGIENDIDNMMTMSSSRWYELIVLADRRF